MSDHEPNVFSEESMADHPIGLFMAHCGQPCPQPVAVAFECGSCCKTAYNCRIAGQRTGFLALEPFCPPGIVIITCCSGELLTDCCQSLLIPERRICAIEVGAVTPMNTSTCPGAPL